ncbi:reverse transcriptase domain-containing protein [Tanacetum coccineum]|uniref:Reverse transcriptase domain-containing protein n=1 Tax=Tanacetum coccineum TaxID=301880 RepID=A0ABQ4Z1E1_9ASTR
MSRSLFMGIVEEVTLQCAFFREQEDCTGKLGISPLIKCTSAIRQLAYGTIPDALDEYLQMGNATSRQYWAWFGCPIAHKAQYCKRDHGPDPFILLEAIASNDLWIWHAFFGVSGSNNDINVTQRSPLLNDLKLDISGMGAICYGQFKIWLMMDTSDFGNKQCMKRQEQDVERTFNVLKKSGILALTA